VSNELLVAGGSAKERPSRAWGEGGRGGGRFDFVMFYGGSDALGGPFVRVLRVGEGFGGLSV